jgi:hypothetical protein
MSSTLHQKPCTEVAPSSNKEKAVKQVKDAVGVADRAILHAMSFTYKWPKQATVSLEEREKSLETLVAVKKLVIDWAFAICAVQVALGEVIQAIDSLLPVIDAKDQYPMWIKMRENVKSAYTYWEQHAPCITDRLAKHALRGEDQWRAMLPTEKLEMDHALLVNTNGNFFLYLRKGNHLDGIYLQNRYTPPEIEALDLVNGMAYAASLLLDPGSILYDAENIPFFANADLTRSLFRWTQVKAQLSDLETPSLPASGAQIKQTKQQKAEAIQQVKQMVLAADRALTDAIGFTNKWPIQLEVSLEEKKKSLKMLVEMKQLAIEWIQAMYSAQVALGEVTRAIDSLLAKLDKEDERQAWMEVKSNVKSTYKCWTEHSYYITNVLAPSTFASEAQWSSLVPSTRLTPLNADVKPPTDREIIRYDLLYQPHSERKYTLAEIEAFEAIDRMTYAASLLLDPGKLVNDESGTFFINANRAKALYLWTQMRARLAAL